ncbi:hypothetical protein [Chitinophaga eiseniae]|uniref:Uncharacterized protein n=1 Tax=Chitinophaga eiseniae TaxID=634771 RepID=A0A847SW19_9BACT|nr:hypothetical protein [Chitinophaga eiseniae]NLR82279.1 hypothetical protein [Chitinophaga eiseniae]
MEVINSKSYSFLVKPLQKFNEEVSELITEGYRLHETKVSIEEELSAFRENIKIWVNKVVEILQSSFDKQDNLFVFEFGQAHSQTFRFNIGPNVKVHLSDRVKKEKDNLREKVSYLEWNRKIIEVCDSISARNSTNFDLRAKYKMAEKLSLLLDRLYKLNDGNNYPIEMLLLENGIRLNNHGEARELAAILENNGYITTLGGLGSELHGAITVSGAMALEESLEPHKENYDEISSDQVEINRKIDSIIETLSKQDAGQEVLYEELQELKELYGQLSKKNWGQILKGKLFDIALEKLADKDVLQFIYENLTGQHLRLL